MTEKSLEELRDEARRLRALIQRRKKRIIELQQEASNAWWRLSAVQEQIEAAKKERSQ
ncbi:hypothetical protein J2J97_32125 (plasmid) [Rhizobium bangladeshense]|uniref:hypothetical protein n=1 Tax=Rhizobium bangladeshense TaxID=1138189 RepID=UPI001A99B0D2|nr:hypothetical protein [Rhizobium bangladeshense]QSY98554.1 hypothetical protein J2J97_32125 [Rhizobium bangladeshense]